MKNIHTIVIGGGQAGLSVSYYLKAHNIEHLVFERADKPAFAWREQRWDSFCFVIPNWTINLPGGRYDEMNLEPDEFISRKDLIQYFESYIAKNQLPVQFSANVTSITQDGNNWKVLVNNEEYLAQNVFIATGFFQKPKYPAFKTTINSDINQLHSSEYRNPSQLKPGGVLIVGSGQSGMQIAEEISMKGIPTFISVGSTPRIPRKYRGIDIAHWLHEIGFMDRTVDALENPKEKFNSNPQISGANGGHDVNLHEFASQGVTLLGHLIDGKDEILTLKGDLYESLKSCDTKLLPLFEKMESLIATNGTQLQYSELTKENGNQQGYKQPIILSLNLVEHNITNIIWANGYTRDYSFIHSSKQFTDELGYPIQKRGFTSEAGLYFIGMPWIHTTKSGLLWGVGEDAEFMVKHLIEAD